MRPLYSSDFQKERQDEFMEAADTWRAAHPCRRHTLRFRTGSRLVRFGNRLIGSVEDGR